MRKILIGLLLLLMIAAAGGRYIIERDVKGLERRLSASQQQAAEERRKISMLRAEWSHVTEAPRLTQLAGRFQADLKLQPVAAHQLLNLADYRQRFDGARLAALRPPLPAQKPTGRVTRKAVLPTHSPVPSANAPALPAAVIRPALKPKAPIQPAPTQRPGETVQIAGSSTKSTETRSASVTPRPPSRPSLAMILRHIRTRKE